MSWDWTLGFGLSGAILDISNLVGVSRFELRMLHHLRNEQRRALRARFQAPDAGTANDRVRDLRKHEIQTRNYRLFDGISRTGRAPTDGSDQL